MDWREFDLFDDKKLLVRNHTLTKMIKKRKERIIQNQLEIKQFQKEMVDINKKLKQYSKLWKPNPQIKHKKQRSGGLYHQMEITTFWGSGKMYVSIGNDEIYNSKTDDEWKKYGRMVYKQRLTKLDKESMNEIYVDFFGISDKK